MKDEYIRKQDAVNAINEALKRVFTEHVGEGIINPLEPADVAPVRHGKWTHKPDVYGVVYCSECNYELHANSTSFCPNCGAKMDAQGARAMAIVVEQMSPADVVEVVRCKECKYWVPGYPTYYGDDFIVPECGIYKQVVGYSGDDFCSYGERREE